MCKIFQLKCNKSFTKSYCYYIEVTRASRGSLLPAAFSAYYVRCEFCILSLTNIFIVVDNPDLKGFFIFEQRNYRKQRLFGEQQTLFYLQTNSIIRIRRQVVNLKYVQWEWKIYPQWLWIMESQEMIQMKHKFIMYYVL